MDAHTILILFLGFFSLKLIWESLLILLNIKSSREHAAKIPAFVKKIIDKESYTRSVEYSITKGKFSLLNDVAGAFFLVLLILSGFLGIVDDYLYSLNIGTYLHGLLFLFSIGLVFAFFSLPFSLYAQFVIEERFGFNKMTPALFFFDRLKALIITVIIAAPLYFVLLWLLEVTGSWWWLLAFGFYTLFQLFITIIYPAVIAPLFNKFTAIEDGSLKQKINALLKKVHYKSKGIFIMDGSKRSKHSNAYFTGIGKTKRIVLFDTLINILKENEITAVLAHEIGHQKKKHIIKMLILSILSVLLAFFLIQLLLNYHPLYTAFGFSRVSLHAVLILLSLCSGAFTFMLTPLFSLLSRKHEYTADKYAAQQVTKGAMHLKNALLSLSKDNLSNLTPHPLYSFYYYSHPTLAERVKALEKL
ncbi:MAG: M48 family metallopeptidase [Spirochaetales bacterium]|nr:M48 family metallopeptidase [Spirochaetales bacterium]